MEGCTDGRAQALNLQCAGRHVDDLGLRNGTALELKALLESLRDDVHTGGGGAAALERQKQLEALERLRAEEERRKAEDPPAEEEDTRQYV